MLKHWDHTECVSEQEFQVIKQVGGVIKPKEWLPDNLAVYVTSETGKRLECIYDPVLKGIRALRGSSLNMNRDLRLYLDALNSEHITVLAVDGLMGTGKTSTAIEWIVGTYLSKVRSKGMNLEAAGPDTHKVFISKPHVNSSKESYGHLPGDINEKLDPTLMNFIQYFDRMHQAGYTALRDAGYINILPLGFIRGLDAENMVIVVDECQNARELVTVVSRKASNSRIFLLGDTSPFQIDMAGNTPTKNGLSHIIDLLKGAPYFQYIEMKTLSHIVRSDEARDLVRRLFKKYGQDPKDWSL